MNKYNANPAGKHTHATPYSGQVRVYANSEGLAVPTWVLDRDFGSAWVEVCVGEYSTKARNDKESVRIARAKLLGEYYPGFTRWIPIYDDTSYHSAMTRGEAGKVTQYGMKDYHLNLVFYEPAETYTLVMPIKTESSKSFAREITRVATYISHFISLNWRPTDPIVLFVEYMVWGSGGAESRRVVYESQDFPLTPAGIKAAKAEFYATIDKYYHGAGRRGAKHNPASLYQKLVYKGPKHNPRGTRKAMMTLTITATGLDEVDLTYALDEIKREVENGNKSGMDSGEDRDYTWDIKED